MSGELRRITTRAELVELARELGVRPDWHEPDEQNLLATVAGTAFDNAGFWPVDPLDPNSASWDPEAVEMYVVLWCGAPGDDGRWKKDEVVATVNLATLFAWATGYDSAGLWPELRGEVEWLRARVAELSNELTNRDARVRRLAEESPAASSPEVEAVWRSRLAREIYLFGEKIQRESGNSSLGAALRDIIDEVGNRVGKMGDRS